MAYKLNEGDKIPPFKVKDHLGRERTREDVIGGPLVLYFYPKDETSICTEEACGFRDHFEGLQKMNALVVGVSPDSAESHQQFIEKNKLNFPLFVDEDKSLCRAFDVLRDGDELERTTFVIDTDGIIQWVERPVKMKGHMKRVIQAVKEKADETVDRIDPKILKKLQS